MDDEELKITIYKDCLILGDEYKDERCFYLSIADVELLIDVLPSRLAQMRVNAAAGRVGMDRV